MGLQYEFIILLEVKKGVLAAPGLNLEIIEDGLGNAHELSRLFIVMGGNDVPHDLLSDFVALSGPCGQLDLDGGVEHFLFTNEHGFDVVVGGGDDKGTKQINIAHYIGRGTTLICPMI